MVDVAVSEAAGEGGMGGIVMTSAINALNNVVMRLHCCPRGRGKVLCVSDHALHLLRLKVPIVCDAHDRQIRDTPFR